MARLKREAAGDHYPAIARAVLDEVAKRKGPSE
jgi:hypothetical protein